MKKKLLLGVVVLFVVGVVFARFDVIPDKVENELLGGVNLPDRCVVFTQLASRSTKGVAKAASGRVLSYKVTSQSTALKFFQFFDRATLPILSSHTPIWSVPISLSTASGSPTEINHVFDSPLRFDTGIAFALSPNLATYSSASNNPLNYLVTLCFE